MSQSDQSGRKLFLIIGLISALLAILPTLILWFIGNLLSVGWVSLIWIIPCGLLAYFLIRAGLKVTTYTLKKVEGEIEITKGGSYNDPAGVYYELQVGDKHSGIGENLAKGMKKENGQIYTIYYRWSSDNVETDLMDSYILSLEKSSTK